MSKKFVCLAAVCLTLAVAGSAGAQVGKGKVLWEYWYGAPANDNLDNLKADPRFPNSPSAAEWRDGMDRPDDASRDNWGGRGRAFLTPPQTGNYTFWTASDDDSEVWLSTDENPANAVKIANVEGWCNYQNWTGPGESPGPNRQSAPIPLVAGKTYYMEVLFSDGTGGGHVSVGWAGPGVGDTPTVLKGDVLTAFIRSPEPLFKASKPDPASGAKEIVSPLFQWTPGPTAVLHEVYMGTNPTPGPAEFMGPMPMAMYFHIPGLTPGATYYWRVDEVDATGAKTMGDVWSFAVQALEAHNPDPPDGMLGRALNVELKWTAGQGAAKHKVFLGTDKAKVEAADASVLAIEQAESTFSPAGLLGATTYYWRVDEVDGTGKVSPGPVWSFGTIDPAGGAVAEYWNGADLAFRSLDLVGPATVVATVPNVNFGWPSGSTKGTNSPDAAINTDHFFGRFTAELKVPVSGKYKLIEVTDDGGLLYLNGVQIAGAWATGGEAELASAELDLVSGDRYILVLEYFESTGGAGARLRWSGPGISKQPIWQGALQIPTCAISPYPRNGAVEMADNVVLSWIAPPKAVVHTVYFGTDQKKVTAGDKSLEQAPSMEAKFVPASALNWNTKYYWRVDELTAEGQMIQGQVWSFTTANFIPIHPAQASLSYDNTVEPFVSQVSFAVPADLTKNGVADLALRFQGRAAAQGSFSYDAATGTYTVGGAGTDIWGTSDQFTYAYKALQGDGSMVVKVTSVGTGANAWAKGGIMIRQSLANNAAYSIMSLTGDTGTNNGGNGAAFQWRPSAGASAAAGPNPATRIQAPYFVKLERKGNDFSGSMSPDGQTWTQLGTTQTIAMTDPVFIGIAVSSHVNATTVRTMTFDSVSTTGNVVPGGPFESWEIINATVNDPAPLSVAIEDKDGKLAVVTHPNPDALTQQNISSGTTVQFPMDLWRIPMSAFTGVDLKNAVKLYLGVGDGKPDGSGLMNFADVRIVKPVVAPDPLAVDITVPTDVLVGLPNDGVNAGGSTSGWPAAEKPESVIDNKVDTKFLHFKGEVEATGFAVTPTIGYTVVTGLTLTTANDSQNRDPVSWELYGARKSIDGPWMLIAKGTVDDFARRLDWPRRWKNVTPIGFANNMAFAHYKVMFPTVKWQSGGLPSTPNSMQIAEVELLGVPAAAPAGPLVAWVSFHGADDVPSNGAKGVGFTTAADKGYTDLLKANGYDVMRYVQTSNPNAAILNGVDLIIVSRSVASSSFQNNGATAWNKITAPMINLNAYTQRKSRLGFYTGNTIPDTTGDVKLRVNDPTHPIFAGISLTDCTTTNPYAGIAVYPTDGTKAAGISMVTEPVNTQGTVLATVSATAAGLGPVGATVIAEWPAGATITHDGGAGTDTLGGHRLMFLTGSRENGGKSSETAGMYDLTDDGAKMFINAVKYMIQ